MRRLGAYGRNRSISSRSIMAWSLAALGLFLAGGCNGTWPLSDKPDTLEKSAKVGEAVVLDVSGSLTGGSASSYQWAQTGGPSARLVDTNSSQLVFTPEEGGEYEFTLTIIDDTGGSRVMTVRVIVSESQDPSAPHATAGPDQTVSRGGSAVLAGAATGGTPPYQYAWTPVDGLDDPAAAQPTASPLATTVYLLTVTDGAGAIASDQVQVTVEQPPPLQAEAGPDQMVLPGGSVVLAGTATGGTPPYQYAWTPADGLNDSTSAQPTATPSANTTYTLTVTDSDGATASDSVTISLGTPVSGPYWTNTTWTAANSPYVLVGDVQIPEAITLTIEPGVQVLYTGTTQIYIRGALIANGLPDQKITFGGIDPATVSGATFIKFEGADLSASQLSYVTMRNSAQAIRVGEAALYDQKPKNTGTLTMAHAELQGTKAVANGYNTTARLVLTDCVLSSSSVNGEYQLGEPIDLLNCTIQDCEIFSVAYHYGIHLEGCSVTDSSLRLNCCGANLSIRYSTLVNSLVWAGAYGDAEGPVNIEHTQCTNVGIYLPNGTMNVTDSTLLYDSAYAPDFYGLVGSYPDPSATVTFGNGNWAYTTVTGPATGTGVEVTGHVSYGDGGVLSVDHCTIQQYAVGILLGNSTKGGTLSSSNLGGNSTYAVSTRGAGNVTATGSYWGTDDAAQIGALIHDYFDDITLGQVIFAPFATAPIPDAGPRG